MTERNEGDEGDVWVCVDCFFAHHYGYRVVDRTPTDDEFHNWKADYLRGHDLPNLIYSDHDPTGYVVREFFAGESDGPCDREPLNLLSDYDLYDDTCPNHYVTDLLDEDGEPTVDTTTCGECGQDGYENGLDEFTWHRCGGCGSTLGGSRYRLHWEERP